MFDNITENDLILAFFPCIYFCQFSQFMQSLNAPQYKFLEDTKKLEKIIERQILRQKYLNLLTKLVLICTRNKIRLIFENPITGSFLNNYFLKSADVKDMNRLKRGDYFKKPTGYWFFNCEPTAGESIQYDKECKNVERDCKSSKIAGICSEERSMIHPDYARNFICDFILGKTQHNLLQGKLF